MPDKKNNGRNRKFCVTWDKPQYTCWYNLQMVQLLAWMKLEATILRLDLKRAVDIVTPPADLDSAHSI